MSFGYQQTVWFVQNPTLYTDVPTMASGSRFILPVRANIAVEKSLARIKTEHMRQVAGPQQAEDDIGVESIAGAISGVVPWKGDFGFIMKNTLGKVITSGSSPPYSHSYTWTDLLFPGFSMAVNRAGATYTYRGCQIASLKLAATVGGPIDWTAELLGRLEVVDATITPPALPSLLAANPYMLFQHGGFKIDTVTEPITGFEFTSTNELESAEDRSYAIGVGTRVALPRSGYGVTGVIKRRHDKDSGETSKFYAKFLSGATARLEIILNHPTEANYYGSIVLATVKFEGKTPLAADKGFIPEEIPFVAYDLQTAPTAIVLVDANADPVTATGAYDGAGA